LALKLVHAVIDEGAEFWVRDEREGEVENIMVGGTDDGEEAVEEDGVENACEGFV
jgi:hypothetical protein